jgi:hypothetical protein
MAPLPQMSAEMPRLWVEVTFVELATLTGKAHSSLTSGSGSGTGTLVSVFMVASSNPPPLREE